MPRDRGQVGIRPSSWQPWRHRELVFATVYFALIVVLGEGASVLMRVASLIGAALKFGAGAAEAIEPGIKNRIATT